MNISFHPYLLINQRAKKEQNKPAPSVDYDTLVINDLSRKTKKSLRVLTSIVAGIDVIYFSVKYALKNGKFVSKAKKVK